LSRCEAVYPDGRCVGEARVEILTRDFYVEGMRVLVTFCFGCAKDAIESGAFESVLGREE